MNYRWLYLCLLLFTLPLAAQSDWNIVGSGGEVDEDSLTLYQYSGARIKFKTGATGTITVRYPVIAYGNANGLQPIWDVMRLTAVTAVGGTVSAKLVQVDECSGEEETFCTVNGSGAPGCSLCIFPPVVDFTQFSYYIEGTLTRSTTAVDPQLIMVSLGY